MSWRQFKLIVSDPPNYSGHFKLIKNEIVPFVENHSLNFWVTNYHDNSNDFILFRMRCKDGFLKSVQKFLNTLKKRELIVDWEVSTWDPGADAKNRIEGLSRIKGFDPSQHIIVGYGPMGFNVSADNDFQKRKMQLTALFECLGECTRVIYTSLDEKPNDLWAMSLFLHLFLNSLDFSGPDPPSEEANIRNIPPA
jgi:hypothetical protein